MKKWNTPQIEELNISETAQSLGGEGRDGYYIGIFGFHIPLSNPRNSNGGGHGNGGNDDDPINGIS
ncbi:MAG: hypothetical protein K6G30_10565 [Acetatifactor sp.]|jgi:hypothetical protein|nr:hypothetical protein [Acetatifactor sp.]